MPGNPCREKGSIPRIATRGERALNRTNMHHATSTWIDRPANQGAVHEQPKGNSGSTSLLAPLGPSGNCFAPHPDDARRNPDGQSPKLKA
jgi:hypothetical protein